MRRSLLQKISSLFVETHNPGLSVVDGKIVDLLSKRGGLPTKEILGKVDEPRRSVLRGLARLKERGMVTKEGGFNRLLWRKRAEFRDFSAWFAIAGLIFSFCLNNPELAVFSGFLLIFSALRWKTFKI